VAAWIALAVTPSVTVTSSRNPFLLLTFVDALGTGAFTASSVILFTRLLHLDSSSITTGLAVASLGAGALLVPVGKIVEGRSLRSTMTVLSLCLAALVPCSYSEVAWSRSQR
jgi:hypothetical protein